MLGFVTIGQSPREDIVASMLCDLPSSSFVEGGALDDLTLNQISALYPNGDELPLVTRLRDGSEVVIGKRRLLPYLHLAVKRLEAAGCTAICVLCTGEFPEFGGSALVVYPDKLLVHVVEALLPAGTLGVLIPHAGQRASMVSKWTSAARSTVTAVASPYSASDQMIAGVEQLVAQGAQAIVLDCMGYDRRMLADARTATDRPVILANGLVGSLLREVFDVSAGILDHVH